MERRFITEEEVMSQQTPAGGWTRKTLAGWGVPFPPGGSPPKGWKEWILKFGIPYGGIEDLHEELDRECGNARDRDRAGDKKWRKRK